MYICAPSCSWKEDLFNQKEKKCSASYFNLIWGNKLCVAFFGIQSMDGGFFIGMSFFRFEEAFVRLIVHKKKQCLCVCVFEREIEEKNRHPLSTNANYAQDYNLSFLLCNMKRNNNNNKTDWLKSFFPSQDKVISTQVSVILF